jgi:hypothetical protein
VQEPEVAAAGIGQQVRLFLRGLLANPAEALLYVPEHLSMRHDVAPDLDVDPSWEEHLHGLLGAPWPCPVSPLAAEIWTAAADDLSGQRLAFGRHTYRGYSDGDSAFARACLCAVIHLRPDVVLETGVARGVTTRFVLEALARCGRGHLWSIDLPHPFDKSLHAQTGAAVPADLRVRWTYVTGSSRRRLGSVLRSTGRVGVFIHDSLHTGRNTRYELDRVAPALVPGGLMLVDDISTHQGFSSFVAESAGVRHLICPSADGLGLFGIARTES